MKLALTFDDGPNDPYTLQLLDVLDRHGVKATFFMVGKFVLQRPNIVSQVTLRGHWIGNHTYSHPDLTALEQDAIGKEIMECQTAISAAIGMYPTMFRPPFMPVTPRMFRPPFMLITDGIERMIEKDFGLKTIRFDAAAGDGGEQLGADHFAGKIVKTLTGRQYGIVLMHDGGHQAMGTDRSQTIEAVDRLITRYKAEGAEFVSPLELM